MSVAAGAAAFGQKVVLIEKGKMGGDCLNYGCVPSKALLAAAGNAHAMTSGEKFGIARQALEVDYKKVHDHVHGVIAGIAPHDSVERFEGLGVRVIKAQARFRDARTVIAGDEVVSARRFVIATGSSPAAPPVPGLGKVQYLTNETIFNLTSLPDHLIIIGGGPIGMEMAQAHRRLGSRVTVLEAFTPLGKDDPELTAIVLGRLRAEGIDIISPANITSVQEQGGGLRIELVHDDKVQTITGSHLLVAAGRKPNVDGLGLEAAGVEFTAKGIATGKGLRTTNRRVYAIGDVTGGLQFTHVAGYQAGLVVKNILFRIPVTAKTGHVPWVTYCDPELANVGLTAAAAAEKGLSFEVLRWSFDDNDRARAERNTDGLAKIVVARNGRILGAGIAGPHAGELIQPWALAISSRLKIKAMVDMIPAYPTLGEVNRRAAITFYGKLPEKPLVRKVIRWLKIFG